MGIPEKILITLFRSRTHNLYKKFIDSPPPGYTYISLDGYFREDFFESEGNFYQQVRQKISRNSQVINLAKHIGASLIYATDGILLTGCNIPWVVDLEHATSLVGHNLMAWRLAKPIVPLLLGQNNLKYILPWTQAGADSVCQNFPLSEMAKKKIKVVHLCSGDVVQRKRTVSKNGSLKILFATSVNYNSENEFYSKGGKILAAVIEAATKTGFNYRFILRTRLPARYQFLRSIKNVIVIEDILTQEKYSKILLEADVLIYPGYQSPGLLFLDAMSHGLPILATDVFANKEMVREGRNGYLINADRLNNMRLVQKGVLGVPSGETAKEDFPDERMVADIINRLMQLDKSPYIVKKMGESARRIYENDFSLARRNRELKKIYDDAIKK